MEQILITIGVLIFGLLGVMHLVYTFFSNKFEAYDPAVTEAMKSSTLILTKETSMWKAWIGFNASHSLGAMLFTGIYLPLCIFHFEIIHQSLWFSVLPVITSLSYLFLAKKYWFKIPFIGILIASICFICAAVLMNI